MARVLHIASSPRGERSQSRKAGQEFLDGYLAAHPGSTVTHRDVGHNPPGHVTEAWVAAAFSPPDKQTADTKAALKESDELVDELLAHDVILVSAPMYNFGVPSTLKAYIDNIVRVGRTFNFDPSKPNPYVPLVHGKKLFAVLSAGGAGYAPGGPMAGLDHEGTYLKAIFGFMGVTDSGVIYVEGTGGGPDAAEAALTKARPAIRAAVAA